MGGFWCKPVSEEKVEEEDEEDDESESEEICSSIDSMHVLAMEKDKMSELLWLAAVAASEMTTSDWRPGFSLADLFGARMSLDCCLSRLVKAEKDLEMCDRRNGL